MPMFSFDKSSYENKLLDLLQGNFFRTAKKNKILAKWAAGRMGYDEKRRARYVRNIIFSYLIVPNDRKIIDRIKSDFKQAGISVTEDVIKQKIKAIESRLRNKKIKL